MNRRKFLATLTVGTGGVLSLPILAGLPSKDAEWPRDGRGSRGRIGVLTPHFDGVPESEMWTLAPRGISVHASRVRRVEGHDLSEPPHVDDAAEQLVALPVNAIVFAFTTSSYLLGPDGEKALQTRLEGRTGGIPLVLPVTAAVTALRALKARRIALIHPPWFSDRVHEAGRSYFANLGFEIVYAGQMRPPRKFTEVTPSELYAWAREHVPSNADALFIGGNGMRAIGAISEIERSLSMPVITANQVAFWQALGKANASTNVKGYGQLLEKSPAV